MGVFQGAGLGILAVQGMSDMVRMAATRA